jgi:hypothetical protein
MGRGENNDGAYSSILYCKEFCVCQNALPHSTTVKKIKNKNSIPNVNIKKIKIYQFYC